MTKYDVIMDNLLKIADDDELFDIQKAVQQRLDSLELDISTTDTIQSFSFRMTHPFDGSRLQLQHPNPEVIKSVKADIRLAYSEESFNDIIESYAEDYGLTMLLVHS